MKTFFALTLVQLFLSFSYGFVLPLDTILKKHVVLNGSKIIALEQDVFFKESGLEAVIHETWLIEGDKNLKLIATGTGDLKDSFKIVALYNGKYRSILIGKNRVTDLVANDFFERYLSVRSADSFKSYLQSLQIQPQVRLSRAEGAVAYAVGMASTPEALNPQAWFKQDSFELVKLRLPSEAEVSLEDFIAISPQLTYPKTKKIEWAGKSALIKVRQISDKNKYKLTDFYPQNLSQPTDVAFLQKSPLHTTIEDFYKRFR